LRGMGNEFVNRHHERRARRLDLLRSPLLLL